MRTMSISGFGGSYEWGCQRMLQLGIDWLKENVGFDFKVYRSFRGVYGVVTTEDAKAKELDEVLVSGDPKLKDQGVTGAMHQAVIDHLSFIHKHTYAGWLAEGAKHRPAEDFFDFDGSEQSCPADKVGPVRRIDELRCRCGHKFVGHAMSMDEAAAKFATGDFTAPCKSDGCTCAGFRERTQ